MAGCYGSHPEDRYFEGMLYDHLDDNDPDFEECYLDDDEEHWDWSDDDPCEEDDLEEFS